MTLSEKRRAAQAARKTRGGNPKPLPYAGGRKRKPDRCPCGENTLTRAQARGFACCKLAGVCPTPAISP